MKCQRCKENDATIQIVQNQGSPNKQIVLLCSQCAKQIGISVPSFAAKQEQSMNALLNHLIGQYFGYTDKPVKSKTVENCSRCGMTVEKFRKKGKLGCPDCYITFSEVLDAVFPKIQQQRTRHKGRSCGQATQLDLSEPNEIKKEKQKPEEVKKKTGKDENKEKTSKPLPEKKKKSKTNPDGKGSIQLIEKEKLLLEEAIAREDYLMAAKIRDKIKALSRAKGDEVE